MNAKNRGRSVLRSRFSCKQFIPRLRGIFLCRTLAPEIRRACPVHAAGRFSDSCVSVHASLPGITCQWHFWRDSAITAAALCGSFTRLPFSVSTRKCLPNAFCGRKPAPTSREKRTACGKVQRGTSQGATAVTAVSPLCAGFGAGVGQGPPKRDFGGVGPRVGKWFLGGRVTENLPSQSSMNSREKRPPGARFWVLRRRSIFVLG